MIGDDMDKAVTDVVSLMLTTARMYNEQVRPIPVKVGDQDCLLMLVPVQTEAPAEEPVEEEPEEPAE